MKSITIKLKRISNKFNNVPLPKYETDHSSGLDVRATLEEDMLLASGKIVLVPTNLSMEIPEGYEIQVRPRSGLAIKHGIGVLNSPGTIDADYRGEIKIILFNFSNDDFIIHNGDRVAQLVVSKVYKGNFEEVTDLSVTERNDGGFGHTGNK